MLSPSSCTATCSASKLPSSSGPTAWASALAQRSSGACQSGLVTKAAVGEPWLLSATKVRPGCITDRSEEHTSELQSPCNLVCRLLLEKKRKQTWHSRALLIRKPFYVARTDRNLVPARGVS